MGRGIGSSCVSIMYTYIKKDASVLYMHDTVKACKLCETNDKVVRQQLIGRMKEY